MSDLAPLDDPSYKPKHPPVNGTIPKVVARWGAASQVRWFRRFENQIKWPWPDTSDQYHLTTTVHKGGCCYSCSGEDDPREFWDWSGCCCRSLKKEQA